MADPQFEEFCTGFESLPQHIKATTKCYQIVHGIDVFPTAECSDISFSKESEVSDKNERAYCFEPSKYSHISDQSCFTPEEVASVQRKRRKLPQIPADKEPLSKFRKWPKPFPVSFESANDVQNPSLNDKQYEFMNGNLYLEIESTSGHIKPYLRVRTKPFTAGEGCSPDDAHERSCNDVDSGHSSSHSPDGAKSVSPACNELSCSSSSTISSLPSTTALQVQDATHRGLYKFLPRHDDEIEVDIGDPVYIHKEADDFWCEGVNLRTGFAGIFPNAYVTDVEYSDFDSEGLYMKRERYLLDFLGSLEVTSHKGNQILLQAVRKILKSQQSQDQAHPCVLEISDNGLRMVDRSKKTSNDVPSQDYFFNLKNVTFCGYHPHNHKYFGFVTKHPLKHKFACHVFMGQSSTRDVAEAVGRAFQRFYQKFMETMYPIEDIYIE